MPRLAPLLLCLLALAGCATPGAESSGADTSGAAPHDSDRRPSERDVAQLWYMPLPIDGLRHIAVHPYFRVWIPERAEWHEWEIRSNARLDAASSIAQGDGAWGHIRLSRAGAFPTPRRHWLGAEWRGPEAARLRAALERSPTRYPFRDAYLYWPGPNSNTYARWVLAEAGVGCDLHPHLVGKDFDIARLGASPTRTGVEASLLGVIGLKLGLLDGVELNLLGLSFGVDFWPPALKTPLGRLGFGEALQPVRGVVPSTWPPPRGKLDNVFAATVPKTGQEQPQRDGREPARAGATLDRGR
ncbi:MAG: DUF3750 domain-containing protein [Planctomycetota bacterium]